jgi:hypothetical protein
VHGARNRHSDREKFRSDLNRPESYEMSERLLNTLRKSGDFQAEYEGSLYFTRSNVFRVLAGAADFVPTNPDAPFQGAGATSSSDICHQSGGGEFNYQ